MAKDDDFITMGVIEPSDDELDTYDDADDIYGVGSVKPITEDMIPQGMDEEILAMIDGSDPKEDEELPGKAKCNVLKAIRRKIAEANGIPYHTEECTYHGPCAGTCPKCDAEARDLNEELKKKEARGEEIVIKGLGLEEIKALGSVLGESGDE